MDNKLKLCIAICDKLPPEEAIEFSTNTAVELTPEQDQALHHHCAILRLQRILSILPENSNHHKIDATEAIQNTISYHQSPDYSPIAIITAESLPRTTIPAVMCKAHGRPYWAALHSAWSSVKHPHISQKYASMCHEFSVTVDQFIFGHEHNINEYRQAATDVSNFLQQLNP